MKQFAALPLSYTMPRHGGRDRTGNTRVMSLVVPSAFAAKKVADRAGFEPATSGFWPRKLASVAETGNRTDRHSCQLSYPSMIDRRQKGKDIVLFQTELRSREKWKRPDSNRRPRHV